jgi:guanine deaminase
MTFMTPHDQYNLVSSQRIYIFNLLHQNVNSNMESEQQEEFMREAIRLSVENVESGNGGPFAAVVVKDGKIIARGVNQVTSSNDPTAHAEVVAIRNACNELNSFQLKGCEIYTSCEPCPMCLGAIYWARPDKLFFANTKEHAAEIAFDDLFIYEELARPLHERKLYTRQLLAGEAIIAFQKWKASANKTEY